MVARRRSYRKKRGPKRRSGRTTRVSRRRTTRPKRKAAPMVLNKFIAAQLNPFDERVAGVKIPDENTVPSVTFAVEDSLTLSSNATYGTACFAVRSPITSAYVGSTSASTTSWTWNAAFGSSSNASEQSSIVAAMDLMRTAAYGVRVSCPLAATTASGYIHICTTAQNFRGQTTWSYPTSLSDMSKQPGYKKFTLSSLTQRPLVVTAKPIDNSAYRYFDPESDLAANAIDLEFHNSGWQDILIAISDVPLAVVPTVSIERIQHVEAIPNKSNFLVGSTPSPSYPQVMQAAANIAAETPAVRTESGMFQQFSDRVSQGAWRYATDTANRVAEAALDSAGNVGYYGAQNLAAVGAAYLGNRGYQQIGY